ncbi:hypothetical protein [Ornithinimicrobium kibberense]|uniref:hypothetical protein n=1 Tax=Ornithinimicrobium kibberense TaxID=282060 RepID=UPI0036207057
MPEVVSRWQGLSSHQPCSARKVNEATVCGACAAASSTTTSPQVVRIVASTWSAPLHGSGRSSWPNAATSAAGAGGSAQSRAATVAPGSGAGSGPSCRDDPSPQPVATRTSRGSRAARPVRGDTTGSVGAPRAPTRDRFRRGAFSVLTY